jgi:hypothetical protein
MKRRLLGWRSWPFYNHLAATEAEKIPSISQLHDFTPDIAHFANHLTVVLRLVPPARAQPGVAHAVTSLRTENHKDNLPVLPCGTLKAMPKKELSASLDEKFRD